MSFTPLEPTPSNLEQQERLGLRGLLRLPSRSNPFVVFLNGCPNPDCPCDSVQLRLLEVAETAEPVEGGVDLTVMIRGLTGTLTDPGDLPRADRILVCQAVEALPALERRAVRRQNAQRSVEENLADALMRGSDVMEGLLQSWSFHAAGGSRNPAGVDAAAGRLSLDGRDWFFDVLYCPNPKCDCKHFNVVGMEPRTNYPDEGTKGPPLLDRFMVQGHLSKPEFNVYESSPGYRKLAIPVVQEWLAGIPNHQALFTRQYQQVREIALRSLQGEGIQTAPIVRPKKIGRNEGCPCGSGLKYKRCCGK